MISLETHKSKFRILFCDKWSLIQDLINFSPESCGNGSGEPTWLELVLLKGKMCWHEVTGNSLNFPDSQPNMLIADLLTFEQFSKKLS